MNFLSISLLAGNSSGETGSMMTKSATTHSLSLEVEAERPVLAGPFGKHVAEASYADTPTQASFESNPDQSG